MDMSLLFGAWAAVTLTLFIFSFLYRENPLFKAAEHLYLGVTVGYFFSVMIYNVWFPKIQEPILSGDFTPLIPALIGLTLLSRLSVRHGWISRFGFAFIMGYGSGVAIPAVLATMLLKQIQGTLVPLFSLNAAGGINTSGAALWDSFSVLLIAVGTVSVLFYFFFSMEPKGAARRIPVIGIYFLMVYLGASFGVTVMSRFSLLYGRFFDLYAYAASGYYYASLVMLVMVAVFLALYARRNKNISAPAAGNGV